MKATVGGSGVICTGEQKQKTGGGSVGGGEYTGVQIVHFYRLLQVDIISKRENFWQTSYFADKII